MNDLVSTCKICFSDQIEILLVADNHSLTTDGRIVKASSYKIQCLECGLLFNPDNIVLENYRRSSGDSPFDELRHSNVANGVYEIICGELHDYSELKILEIGAGNFQTSLNLSALDERLIIWAVEPSPENSILPKEINCFQGRLEDFDAPYKFDFIFSNQVIEHTSEPLEFVKAIDDLLSLNGMVLFCCPTQTQIAAETLFIDHLYHFSEESFKHLIRLSGFVLTKEFIAPWDKFTHCYVINRKGISCNALNRISPIEALESRKDLVKKFRELDTELSKKIKPLSGPIYLFGAGEFSQIIECYAPEFFQSLKSIVVTKKNGHRIFDQNILMLEEVTPNNGVIVLGVHKESQAPIVALLINFGWDEEKIITIF